MIIKSEVGSVTRDWILLLVAPILVNPLNNHALAKSVIHTYLVTIRSAGRRVAQPDSSKRAFRRDANRTTYMIMVY